MERKLVSIQVIKEVKTHPNADSLDLATVLGWQVVTKRDEFKAGDLCVFFEVDSVLPELPVFEFMRNKHFRVRTIRLRKELSQGLAMPLSMLFDPIPPTLMEGQDVAGMLGVKKYEHPLSLVADAKGPFPFFIPKTDEIRVQSVVPGIFDELHGKNLYVTTKMDGTSSTFYLKDGVFGVCSRNLELKESDSPYWAVAKKYNIESKLRLYSFDIAIQGEICGPGIQGNPLKLTEYKLFVFSIHDIERRKYFSYDEFVDLVKTFEIDRVPCQTDQFIFDKNKHDLNYLLEHAKGKYEGTDNDIEGIVIRPVFETHSEVLDGRLSIKVLNNDYLEREK